MTCQTGRTPEPGMPLAALRPADRHPQALHAPVEVGDRALLLGIRLAGEDDVGVLAHGLGHHALDRDHGLGGAERLLPQRAVGEEAHRVGVVEPDGRQLAGGQALGDPARVAAGLGVRVAGAVAGREARLAQAARVRHRRHLDQPRAGAAAQAEPRRQVEQRLRAVAVERALAVDDHQVLAGVAQPGRELAVLVGQQRAGAARRDPRHRHGLRVERRRPRARHRELDVVAADALADPQVEHRRLVDRVAVDAAARRARTRGRGSRPAGPGRPARARPRAAARRAGARPGSRSRAPRGTAAAAGRPPRWWSPRRRSPPVRAPAFFSAPPAAASAFSHEAGISSVPSRTSGSTIRSSECTCW